MNKLVRLWIVLLTLLILILPLTVTAQESGPIYIVQAGDTLSAIARRFGISQQSLIAAILKRKV